MSFAIRNLSVFSYANGSTLWHFKSPTDSLDSISRSGYFNDASDMFTVGDIIVAVGKGGARMLLVSQKWTAPHSEEVQVVTAAMS